MRRDEEYMGKRMMRMDVRRRKGRPKQRCMGNVNVDLRGKKKVVFIRRSIQSVGPLKALHTGGRDCRGRRHKTRLCGDNWSET